MPCRWKHSKQPQPVIHSTTATKSPPSLQYACVDASESYACTCACGHSCKCCACFCPRASSRGHAQEPDSQHMRVLCMRGSNVVLTRTCITSHSIEGSCGVMSGDQNAIRCRWFQQRSTAAMLLWSAAAESVMLVCTSSSGTDMRRRGDELPSASQSAIYFPAMYAVFCCRQQIALFCVAVERPNAALHARGASAANGAKLQQ